MKRALLACLPLVFAACGTIRVGSVPLPDVTVVVPPEVPALPLPLDRYVVYKKQNYFSAQNIPSLVNSVGIEGRAEYAGAGDVRALGVYVRQGFDASCVDLSALAADGAPYVICPAEGEDGNGVGGMEFPASPPKVTNFNLASAKIIAAARAGVGYFGIRVGSGGVVAGDTLRLTNLQAVARF